MRTVILASDDVIDGVARSKGELCNVPDDYDNAARVVAISSEVAKSHTHEVERVRAEASGRREKIRKDKEGPGNGGGSKKK